MLYVHGADGRRAAGRGRPGRRRAPRVAAIYDAGRAGRRALPRALPRRVTSPGRLRGRRAGHGHDHACSSASGAPVPDVELDAVGRGRAASRRRLDRTPTASRRVAVHAAQRRRRRRSRCRPSRRLDAAAASTRRDRPAAPNGQRLVAPDSQTVTGTCDDGRVQGAGARRVDLATPAELVARRARVRDRVDDEGRRRRLPGDRRPRGSSARSARPARSAATASRRGRASGRRTARRLHDARRASRRSPAGTSSSQTVPGDAGRHRHRRRTAPTRSSASRSRRSRSSHTRSATSRSTPGHADHRPRRRRGPRRREGDVQAALYGPFASRDAITCDGHAGLDGHGRGQRRRRVPHRAVQGARRPATTPTARPRRERVRAADRDAVRRRRRDDGRRRGAEGRRRR